jgi:hypothetical protein
MHKIKDEGWLSSYAMQTGIWGWTLIQELLGMEDTKKKADKLQDKR